MELNKYDIELIKEDFRRLFGTEPLLVRSPGRINIIGEHTDYNEGFVLPAAIDKAAYVAVAKREDNNIHLYSRSFREEYACSLMALFPRKTWTDYVLGVVDQLLIKGYGVGGFNLVLDGDIIIGAGLSSSAAVECSVVYALNTLFELGLSKMEMVKLAQAAEHSFAGVKCGIMDQFASMFGKKGYAIQLDCRSLEYNYIPLHMEGISVLLLNSNVSHSLASSEYNTRREQCEQGVSWIKKFIPEIVSLRDVTLNMLERYVLPKDALIYKRCRYVVEENVRLQSACDDLKQGDIQSLGKKMFLTHNGLSKEYEVSCREIDWLVDYVRNNPEVLGARMMGGGFGGCSINLVKEKAIDPLVEHINKQYKEATGLTLDAYVVQIENGTENISFKSGKQ